jgi:hypothetical protein
LEVEELRIEYDRSDGLWVDDPRALQRVWDAPNGELTLEEPLEALRFVQSGEGGLSEIAKLPNFDESPRSRALRYPLQTLRVKRGRGELDREDCKVEGAAWWGSPDSVW